MQSEANYQDFRIIKQKIIKTNEVINLFVEKNKELNTVQEQLNKFRNEIEKYKLENERLSFNLNTLTTKYAPLDKDYNLLKTKYLQLKEDYEVTVNNLQIKYQSVNQELTECKQSKVQTIIKTSPQKDKNKMLNKQIVMLTDDLEKMKNELEEKNKEICKLKIEGGKKKKKCQECNKLTILNYEYRKEMKDLNAIVDGLDMYGLEIQLKAKTTELENLMSTNNTNINKIKVLNSSLDASTMNNQKLKKENDEINRQIEKYKTEMAQLLRQPEKCHKEIQTDVVEIEESNLDTETNDYQEIDNDAYEDDGDDTYEDDDEISSVDILAIFNEMKMPRTISPLESSEDYVSRTKCKSNENPHFDDDPNKGQGNINQTENQLNIVSPIVISEDEVSRTKCKNNKSPQFENVPNKAQANINQTENQSNMNSDNVDLFKTLVALKEANINFTISNNNLDLYNIWRPALNENMLLKEPPINLSVSTTTRVSLKCNLSCCESESEMLCNNNEELLGFVNIKKEKKQTTVQPVINLKRNKKTNTKLISKNIMNSLADLVCRKLRENNYCKRKSKRKFRKRLRIPLMQNLNCTDNEYSATIANPPLLQSEVMPFANPINKNQLKERKDRKPKCVSNKIERNDNTKNCENVLIETDFDNSIISINTPIENINGISSNSISSSKFINSSENSTYETNGKLVQTIQQISITTKIPEISQSSFVEEIDSKRTNRKRKLVKTRINGKSKINILQNIKRRFRSNTKNTSSYSTSSSKSKGEEIENNIRKRRIAHTPKNVLLNDTPNTSCLEEDKINEFYYSCQSPNHLDDNRSEIEPIIIPLERVSETKVNDSMKDNILTKILMDSPLKNKSVPSINSVHETGSADASSMSKSYLNESVSSASITVSFVGEQKPPKAEKLSLKKIRKLFAKLMNESQLEESLNYVTDQFKNLSPLRIAKLIIWEVTRDFTEPYFNNNSIAPVMTNKQRILLGFMTKLENMNIKPIYDNYLNLAEVKLIKTKSLKVIERILRLYIAVCRLRFDLIRMRRFCCDLFYFTGDLAVPIFFIILKSWSEVLPLEISSSAYPLAKVLVQIVHLKTFKKPGYNLLPLNDLLAKFYGYPTERWNSDDIFQEVYEDFIKNPNRNTNYTILVLCKNCPEKFVSQKINEYFIPLIDQINSDNFKATIIILIGNLSFYFSQQYVDPIKEYLNNLTTTGSSSVVQRSIELSLKRLERNK